MLLMPWYFIDPTLLIYRIKLCGFNFNKNIFCGSQKKISKCTLRKIVIDVYWEWFSKNVFSRRFVELFLWYFNNNLRIEIENAIFWIFFVILVSFLFFSVDEFFMWLSIGIYVIKCFTQNTFLNHKIHLIYFIILEFIKSENKTSLI